MNNFSKNIDPLALDVSFCHLFRYIYTKGYFACSSDLKHPVRRVDGRGLEGQVPTSWLSRPVSLQPVPSNHDTVVGAKLSLWHYQAAV